MLISRIFRILTLVVFLGTPLVATAQDPAAQDAPPFGFAPSDEASDGEQGLPVQVSAEFTLAKEGQPARLFVTATMDIGWHIYSVNQKPGGPVKTEILLDSNSKVKLAGAFRPLTKPGVHLYQDIWPGLPVEEHEFSIVWFVPITIPEGVDPKTLLIEGTVVGQVCKESCIPISLPFVARLGKGVDVSSAPPVAIASKQPSEGPPPKLKGPTFSGEYQAENSAVSIRGQLLSSEVAPGTKTTLFLTATPDADFHIYALADHDPRVIGAGKPTLIQFEHISGLDIEQVTTGSEVHEESIELGKGKTATQYSHNGPVSWSAVVRVPKDAVPGPHVISGIIGYQVCRENSCQFPEGARFQVTLNVGPQSNNSPIPVTFVKAKYGEAARFAAGQETPKGSQEPSGGQTTDAEESSIWYLLLWGFLGGAILNVMPCVLPVIGLKIMSFVQQAGESRSRAFALNVWFSVGLIMVWLVMAIIAIVIKFVYLNDYSQGEHLAYDAFNIPLASLVFVMSLSLLGVWEIPIPGFIGSGKANDLAAREGLTGALLKGILTTILATPCIGPFMGTALGEALQRSPIEIFAMFLSLGLGMACPYLIIGLEPRLLAFLPKPGAWMETFKQIMGFVLLGTVVWILTFIEPAAVVPSMLLMVGLGAGCWWIGHIPVTASGSQKAIAWGTATLTAVLVGWLAFGFVGPDMEKKIERLIVSAAAERGSGSVKLTQKNDDLPWELFSESRFEEVQREGKTIMVDFTADWCGTCKFLEHTVLNTKPILEVVERNGVLPLLADYTKKPKNLAKRISDLHSAGVPVLAIYPAGSKVPSTVFRDAYTTEMLIEALEKAGPSRNLAENLSQHGSTKQVADSGEN